MKRLATMLLCSMMVLVFAACGGSGGVKVFFSYFLEFSPVVLHFLWFCSIIAKRKHSFLFRAI